MHRPAQRIHPAYPYEDYKGTLSESSQTMLEKQYAEAQQQDKIVVFVRDEATRRLISFSIDYE